MSNIFDVGVIGTGVAGAFTCLKLATDYNAKVIAFDIGPRPAKRKPQMFGFLGLFPSSDGKLYQNDIIRVSELVGLRKAKSTNTQINQILSNIEDFKIVKDKSPSLSMDKKLKKLGYDVKLNNYIQMYPKDIHSLSKYIAGSIENLTFSFDNEVRSIIKQKNIFLVTTDLGEYRCKKVVIAVGRSGWRWARDLYASLGIIDNNDFARFGIRMEISSDYMKDFNKSNCSLIKDDLEIGPLSWFGTVIPEDHTDLAISSFRSNEMRWKTDKVSFNLIGNRNFPNNGFEQTDRLGKLVFILANDRVIKERISSILSDKSKISILPEYNWMKKTIMEFSSVIPEIITKGYFHVPTIIAMPPKINISKNLETEIDGMFVAGESAGVPGLLSAALMGLICADSVCK